jgi:hypothetical protein
MFANLKHALAGDRSEKAPVVKEDVKHKHVKEVQPVIEKDVHQTEVQQVIQPVVEHHEGETHHTGKTVLPVETRKTADQIDRGEEEKLQRQRAAIHSERTEETVDAGTKVLEPIVHENVKTHVVEEVQPVIEKTVEETHIEHVEQPIKVNHVAAPIVREPVVREPITREH